MREYISTFLTVFSGLLGVVIGAWLTARHNNRENQKKLLMECYSEMVAACIQWITNSSITNFGAMLAAIEKTRMICSKEADAVLEKFENFAISSAKKPTECISLLRTLREQAHKEIENT